MHQGLEPDAILFEKSARWCRSESDSLQNANKCLQIRFMSNGTRRLQPQWLRMEILFASRAPISSIKQSAVGTLPNGYIRQSPLPRIPTVRVRVPRGILAAAAA